MKVVLFCFRRAVNMYEQMGFLYRVFFPALDVSLFLTLCASFPFYSL